MKDNIQNIFPEKISTFIGEHHVMTLATIDKEGAPQCSNIFFAFDKESSTLIFTSSTSTEHGSNMQNNSSVAASIVLETKVIGKIRGLQMKGKATLLEGENESKGKAIYIKKFPFAIVAPLELWGLKIEKAKLTDNRLGFGTKLNWEDCERAENQQR